MNNVNLSGRVCRVPQWDKDFGYYLFAVQVGDPVSHRVEIVECICRKKVVSAIIQASCKRTRLLISGSLRRWENNSRSYGDKCVVEVAFAATQSHNGKTDKSQDRFLPEQPISDLPPPKCNMEWWITGGCSVIFSRRPAILYAANG